MILNTKEKKIEFYHIIVDMVKEKCLNGKLCDDCSLKVSYFCTRVNIRHFLNVYVAGNTYEFEDELLRDQFLTVSGADCDSVCKDCPLMFPQGCLLKRLKEVAGGLK